MKYVNEICDRGGTPDLAKITKGLPEKDKLRISQKTNAALFDGAADRPDKDFGPNTSRTAATLTGTGGQVTDLKSSEPNTPKFSQVAEFSLASAKNTQASTAKASSAPPCPLPGEIRVHCFCPNDKSKDWGMQCQSACTTILTTPGNCGWGIGIEIDWDKYTAGVKKLLKDLEKTIKDNINWIKEEIKKHREAWDQRKIDEWKERSKNLLTAFMVCNGKGGFRPQLNKYADAPCGVAACSKIHEETHIKDFKKSEKYKNWCVAPDGTNEPNGTIVAISDPPFHNNTECNAFTAGAACLESKRDKTPTTACKTFLTEQLNESNFKRLEFCKW
ncbi:MAG: hypothetical protein HY796_11175 [Elusimicrobia bacterium]|nr:hypothetical protein [Elusimicrobiota bacterium]